MHPVTGAGSEEFVLFKLCGPELGIVRKAPESLECESLRYLATASESRFWADSARPGNPGLISVAMIHHYLALVNHKFGIFDGVNIG